MCGNRLLAQGGRLTVAQSYTRARALLDSSIAVHGGLDALRAAGRIAVTMRGTDYWRNQSRHVDPPYDGEPFVGVLQLDVPENRMVWTTTSQYPGGFFNRGRLVIDGPHAFYANLQQRVFVTTPGRTIDGQRDVFTRLPSLVLLAALDHAAGLRWLGPMRLTTGAPIEAIAASTPTGQLTLGMDPVSKRLRAVLDVQADPIAGDAAVESAFSGYRYQQNLLVPGRQVTRVAGEMTQDVEYTDVTLNSAIPDSLLGPPPGLAEFPLVSAHDTVAELAPSVWAIRSSGYWSLVVGLTDYMLVVEAPGTGVPSVIDRIKTLAHGRPIRYVTATHHHDDHAGGMRYYMAAGATVVTTPGNRHYFERMARAASTLQPSMAKALPEPVRIETITGGERTFGDGTRTVELHDIGPSPHAAEMLVAWLPNEGILFQGDQLNLPPNGAILPGGPLQTMQFFASWVRHRGWPVRVLAGVHMTPGTMEQLDQALRAAGPPPG